jgi:hypothetical protein
VGCGWAKPAHPHPLEFRESGAKATAWEVTSKRLKDGFFSDYLSLKLSQITISKKPVG